MPIYKMEGSKNGKNKYRVRINYKDDYGNYKQIEKIVYGSSEAKDMEQKLMKEIKEMPPESKITVQKLYDDYIEYIAAEIRETTLEKKKQILSNHVLPTLGKKKISDLNKKVLRDWKKEISEKDLAHRMRYNIYSEFRAMLNYGVKYDDLRENPLLKVGNFKDAYETKKEINYYTVDEFFKFIEQAKITAERNGFYEWNYYVFFNIAFYTGMRKGEIYALKWTDIEDEILHVRRSITQKLKGEDKETPPKNKSSYRSLQIPIPLKNILDEHYNRYKAVDGFTDDWRVCGGIKCIRDNTVNNRNETFAKLAGIKKIRIHDFRHTHASLLANEGINIQEIARRLGHSQIEETWNTYSHLYPREEERAVKILNKFV